MSMQPFDAGAPQGKKHPFGGQRGYEVPSLGAFLERWFANRFVNRIAHKAAFASAMLLCLLWSAASALQGGAEAPAPASFQEWPSEWDGAPCDRWRSVTWSTASPIAFPARSRA
ncbi:hypothetical protein ACQ858_21960 [Variovorax ureilyticus]|uniref:hypothetical protein n=1 Tax=Variovorax ureilyticus TaxID=1836198 RepID=UPI003D67C89E